jgi:hypothetical protein
MSQKKTTKFTQKSNKTIGKSSSSSYGNSTTRFGLKGQFTFTMTAGSVIDQITPVLLGAPLSTIAEEFLFWKFHRLKFRIVRWNLDATLAETPKLFALGVFQASNAIGTPTIATAENSVKNVQYGRTSHIAPEVAPTFTCYYEWLEPDLAVGPLGGWFRTVSGSDDEDGDSAGILYMVSDVTTGNTSNAIIEYEVDVEFKEIVENTITPASGSISQRFPGFRSLPGCSKPRFLDLRNPANHPIMARIRWPLQSGPPRGLFAVPFGSSSSRLTNSPEDSIIIDMATSSTESKKERAEGKKFVPMLDARIAAIHAKRASVKSSALG